MPHSLAALEQQRSEILMGIFQWLHHRHSRPLRETQLPVSSARPATPRAKLPLDPQSKRIQHQRELCLPRRVAQGPTRGGSVPSFSATQPRVGGERKDLPRTPGAGRAHAEGKRTAAAIHQEIAREVEQVVRVVFRAAARRDECGSATIRSPGQRQLEFPTNDN